MYIYIHIYIYIYIYIFRCLIRHGYDVIGVYVYIYIYTHVYTYTPCPKLPMLFICSRPRHHGSHRVPRPKVSMLPAPLRDPHDGVRRGHKRRQPPGDPLGIHWGRWGNEDLDPNPKSLLGIYIYIYVYIYIHIYIYIYIGLGMS